MTGRGMVKRVERLGHDALRRLDRALVPASLRRAWRATPPGADRVWVGRLARDRAEIIPWLSTMCTLDGSHILEIGSGRGASTFAMREQGASVTAVDVNEGAIAYAKTQLGSAGLEAEILLLNAAELAQLGDREPFDLVIFWASLEHMTVSERLTAIREAWSLLAPGSNLVVIETPNRLWPYDSHTAFLPFFNWLPDELAFDYVQHSERDGLADTYVDPERQMLEFQRLGRGVSYHEFELALGKGFVTSSSMQIHRRSRNPVRRLAWSASSSGRVERHLHSFAPHLDRAWLQPFLYLAIAKP